MQIKNKIFQRLVEVNGDKCFVRGCNKVAKYSIKIKEPEGESEFYVLECKEHRDNENDSFFIKANKEGILAN